MVDTEIDYATRNTIDSIKSIIQNNLKLEPHIFCCIAKKETLLLPPDFIKEISPEDDEESIKNKYPVILMDVKELLHRFLRLDDLDRAIASSRVSKKIYIKRMVIIEMVKALYTTNGFTYFSFEPSKGIILDTKEYGLNKLEGQELIDKIKSLKLGTKLQSLVKSFYKMECHTPTHKMFAIYDIVDGKLVLSNDAHAKDKKFLIWESKERITGKEIRKYDPQNEGYHNLAEDRLFEYADDLGKFFGTF